MPMNSLETFGENLYLLTDIELGINKNPKDIDRIFFEIKEMMMYVEQNSLKNLYLFLKAYLELTLLSIGNSFYQEQDFIEYKKLLVESCKKVLFWKKNIVFLKQELLKKEKSKNYQDLTSLYTILYFLVCSKHARILRINDENLYITSLIKGYSYESNKCFDDLEYDEEIKESILEYKRQRKEENE